MKDGVEVGVGGRERGWVGLKGKGVVGWAMC